MTSLLMIRHGATDWNHDGRYQGQSDTPLNGQGIGQARELGKRLRGAVVAAAYSSDLSRALQTAEIVSKAIGSPPVVLDKRLREIDLGEWEGRLATEIQREYPDLWMARRTDPANTSAPGGETGVQVAERVLEFLQEIGRRHPGDRVMVVSHGYALATAICLAEGLPLAQAPDLIPENAVPVEALWSSGAGAST
jgi:broad specificity phosphatase PhoE